jgi:hypothetical protein
MRVGRYRYNLVMYASPLLGHPEPYFKVARYVRELDPEIRPYVITYDRHPIGRFYRHVLKRFILPRRPTLIFSPAATDIRLWGGTLYKGQRLDKSLQYAALERRSIPVPQWALLTQDFQPDLSQFGSYVVVKPDRGGLGAEVRIMRRGRVRWRPVTTNYAGVSEALIVQAFIQTGPRPVSYRVSTLFGQVLYCVRYEASHAVSPGETGGDGSLAGWQGANIVSTSKGCTIAPSYDQDIIRFGERAHAAFPEIPLLGVDVIREQPSGRLFALEVNPAGAGWHFTHERGLKVQRQFGFSYEQQFDGLRKAATILIERTRREAC